jgi:hypothetical protein
MIREWLEFRRDQADTKVYVAVVASGKEGCSGFELMRGLERMIEGLKIELSSTELQEHLAAKATYHEARGDAYKAQAVEIRKLGGTNVAQSNDPAHSLEMSRDQHYKRADYFGFLSARIIPNETYRLQEHDLERLEWFSRLG